MSLRAFAVAVGAAALAAQSPLASASAAEAPTMRMAFATPSAASGLGYRLSTPAEPAVTRQDRPTDEAALTEVAAAGVNGQLDDSHPHVQAILAAFPEFDVVICIAGCFFAETGQVVYARARSLARLPRDETDGLAVASAEAPALQPDAAATPAMPVADLSPVVDAVAPAAPPVPHVAMPEPPPVCPGACPAPSAAAPLPRAVGAGLETDRGPWLAAPAQVMLTNGWHAIRAPGRLVAPAAPDRPGPLPAADPAERPAAKDQSRLPYDAGALTLVLAGQRLWMTASSRSRLDDAFARADSDADSDAGPAQLRLAPPRL